MSESTESSIKPTNKRRRDGTLFRTKEEMIESYKKSYLPYPLSAFYHLDYCKKILKVNLYNSIFFAMPFSLVLMYAFIPHIKIEGFKLKHKRIYFNWYLAVYLLLMSLLAFDMTISADYCNPKSFVYQQNSNDDYRGYLKKRIQSVQTEDFKITKTKSGGLSDDEL